MSITSIGDGRHKVTTATLAEKKSRREPITCLTAYDYATARLVDEAGIDLILVGDSLAQVVLGYENTLPVTMEEMLHHTRAVRRAVKHAFLVADMPYASYHVGVKETLRNATKFVKYGGAEAVKIEGGTKRRNADVRPGFLFIRFCRPRLYGAAQKSVLVHAGGVRQELGGGGGAPLCSLHRRASRHVRVQG